MKRKSSRTQDEAIVFRGKKMMRIEELQSHLDCSRRTVQRRLDDWNAIRSYNRNGSFYTLPNIPKFDANGLWRYRGVFFSKFGNLPETFAHLVAQAPAGLRAAEAGELLGIRPSSFLWSLREHPAIERQRHGGRYLYVSSDAERCREQVDRRKQIRDAARLPTDAEAVAILIEKVKHPALSHEELSRRLVKQKVFVEPEIVRSFFARHDLTVKKTPHSV